MTEENKPHSEAEPPCVYVIEDDDVQRRGLASYLSREGFVVKVFPDGESAINMIREDRDHVEQLVVCDYRLPGSSGLEVFAGLAGTVDAGRFILISAYLSDELASEASSMGVTRTLEKPLILEQLVAECREALSSGRQKTVGKG